MEKKLIEYLKEYCKTKQTGQVDKGYGNCLAEILQIIDVAEFMFGKDEKPRRKRRHTKTELESLSNSTAEESVRDKPWRCHKEHYFDFPKKSQKDHINVCPVCLTKNIEKNPNFDK